MKAIVFKESLPSDHPDALVEHELSLPSPGPRDVLVSVRAIAVNPVDCKIRRIAPPPAGEVKVLGWDASGVVEAIGAEVTAFKLGDEVYYAGDLTRQGCNAEFQCVDERIVALKPSSIGFAEAAALPLTSLTAWELLFDRLNVPCDDESAMIAVTAAAGGVGSIMVQLIKQLTKARCIATASRPESQQWVRDLGADYVVNHHDDLCSQVRSLNLSPVSHVASLLHSDKHYEALCELLMPQGKFGLIDDPEALDIKAFKRKSISLHWEFMYTRSLFDTPDMARQGHILKRIAEMVDKGLIKSTVNQVLGNISAANLLLAHRQIESQTTVGKLVLEGF